MQSFWYIKNPSITKLNNLKNSLSQLYNASAYLNNGNLTASNHLNFFKMQYIYILFTIYTINFGLHKKRVRTCH